MGIFCMFFCLCLKLKINEPIKSSICLFVCFSRYSQILLLLHILAKDKNSQTNTQKHIKLILVCANDSSNQALYCCHFRGQMDDTHLNVNNKFEPWHVISNNVAF